MLLSFYQRVVGLNSHSVGLDVAHWRLCSQKVDARNHLKHIKQSTQLWGKALCKHGPLNSRLNGSRI